MAEPIGDPEFFVLCMFKRCQDERKAAGIQFMRDLGNTVRVKGGKVTLLSYNSEKWEVFDGREHLIAPNHLKPAIFDFNGLVLAAFPDVDLMHIWWNSEEVFNLMKNRSTIEKLGIFTINGLQKAVDVSDEDGMKFDNKFVLLELIRMENFKPVQHFVDAHRVFTHRGESSKKLEVTCLFSESIYGVLMGEYPLDALCATTWRRTSDCRWWRGGTEFQREMAPLVKDCKRLSVLVQTTEPEDYVKPALTIQDAFQLMAAETLRA